MQIFANVGWTVFFTVIPYFVMIRFLGRKSSGEDVHDLEYKRSQK